MKSIFASLPLCLSVGVMCLMRVEGSTLMGHHRHVCQFPENKIERKQFENAETPSSSPPFPIAFDRAEGRSSTPPSSAYTALAQKGMPYQVMP